MQRLSLAERLRLAALLLDDLQTSLPPVVLPDPPRPRPIFGSVLPAPRAHLLTVHSLPSHHRDPFDRLLIAQSLSDGMTFVSGDAQIGRYDVARLLD